MREPGSSRGFAVRHAPLFISAAIFIVSVVVALLRGDPGSAAIPASLILACIPPFIVEKWVSVRIPARLILLYAALLLGGPYLGSHLDFYAVWSPWDTVVHFYSGLPIAFGTVFVLGITAHRYSQDLPAWLEAVFVVSVGTTLAVLWEVAEFIADHTIGTIAQEDNFDTMTDLIGGVLSPAIVAIALVLLRERWWFRSLAPRVSRPLVHRGA